MTNVELSLSLAKAKILRYYVESIEDPELQSFIEELDEKINGVWNPNKNQQEKCTCGHAYERHFDSYEDMYPVGCKYCVCLAFKEKK